MLKYFVNTSSSKQKFTVPTEPKQICKNRHEIALTKLQLFESKYAARKWGEWTRSLEERLGTNDGNTVIKARDRVTSFLHLSFTTSKQKASAEKIG